MTSRPSQISHGAASADQGQGMAAAELVR